MYPFSTNQAYSSGRIRDLFLKSGSWRQTLFNSTLILLESSKNFEFSDEFQTLLSEFNESIERSKNDFFAQSKII